MFLISQVVVHQDELLCRRWGVSSGQKGNGLVGPVMHHGIKNGNDVEHHYFQPLDIISRLARE